MCPETRCMTYCRNPPLHNGGVGSEHMAHRHIWKFIMAPPLATAETDTEIEEAVCSNPQQKTAILDKKRFEPAINVQPLFKHNPFGYAAQVGASGWVERKVRFV